MRVLIVEPSNDLGGVLVGALKQVGIVSDHAKSAQQAISLADSNKPDAVVLELALPNHNGVEFLYEFRSYADWNSVPIIFYSQISAEECGLSSEQMKKLGVAEHFYKPTTPLKTLRNMLLDMLQDTQEEE